MKNIFTTNNKIAKKIIFLFVVVFVFLFAKNIFAAPGKTINYQGKLTNSSDQAVTDGNYNFTLTIWDSVSGGSCVWSARGSCVATSSKSVAVSGGIFSTALGEAGDSTLDLDFNSDYYLQLQVNTDSPMSPRKKINGSAYALNSIRLNGQLASNYLDITSNSQIKAGALTTYGAITAPYFTATSTTATSSFTNLSVSANSQLGTIINGSWQASAIGVSYGGTGLTSTPTYGQLLVGNSSNGYTLTATSSLGINSSQWVTSGSNIYYNTGNVGIGTTSDSINVLNVSGTNMHFEDPLSNYYTDTNIGNGAANGTFTQALKIKGGDDTELARFGMWTPDSGNNEACLRADKFGSNSNSSTYMGNSEVCFSNRETRFYTDYASTTLNEVANDRGGEPLYGLNLTQSYSGLDDADEGYTAFRLNIENDAQPTALGPRNLMDLQVGGLSRMSVSASNTNATIDGTDLVTNGAFSSGSGWTFGTGWSWNTDHAQHSGADGNLSQTLAITVGDSYLVSYTLSSCTTGDMQVTLGGNIVGPRFINGNYAEIITANDTSDLIFISENGFDGWVSNVSVKKITQSSGLLTLTNSSGYELSFRSSGSNNPSISLGHNAGKYIDPNNSFASGNMFMGTDVGAAFTYGSHNTFTGNWSAEHLQSGSDNSGVGYWAGGSLVSGDTNVFMGRDTGGNLAFGSNNTLLGGYVGSSGASNEGAFSNDTFVGAYSGYNNVTGGDNVFLGDNSGYNNLTGYRNTYLGSYAAYGNQNGYGNVVVGRNSLHDNIGSENAALGWDAGNQYAGADAAYFGTFAGYGDVFGHGNTAIGNQALYGAGTYNNYQSTGAITSFTSNGVGGTRVTSPGHTLVNGGRIIITGTLHYNGTWDVANVSGSTFDIQFDGNTELPFKGDDATGNWYLPVETANTALGYKAGYSNTTGTGNLLAGYQAGFNNITSGENVFLGYQAGYGSSTIPLSNGQAIFIGSKAGYNDTVGDNVFIGHNAGTLHETGGQNVLLGNWALNVNISGEKNTALGHWAGGYNRGSGNVFIGNNAGVSELGSNRLYIANDDPNDSTFNNASSSALIYGEFDNRLLKINGTMAVTGTTTFNGVKYNWPGADGFADQVLKTDGSGHLSWVTSSGVGGTGAVKYGQAGSLAFYPANGDTATGTTGDLLFWDNTNARLGIGTTSPYAKLSVAGETVASYFTATTTTATSTFASINVIGNLWQNGAPFAGSQWGTSGSDIYYNTGKVGIGTSSPNLFELQVAGGVGPDLTNTYALGSDTNRWGSLFLSGADTLHMGATGNETVFSYNSNRLDIKMVDQTVMLLHADGTNHSTSIVDEVGHTMTAHGNAEISTTAQKFGSASLSFDGSGDYVTAPDSPDWDFGTGDFTLEAWVNPNNTSGVQRIVSAGSDNDGAYNLWTLGYGDVFGGGQVKLDFAVYNGVGYNDCVSSAITLNAGTWYHIVAARSGNTIYFFVNGASAGSAAINTQVNGGTYGAVVGARESGGGLTEYANAYIDELRISKAIARWTSAFTPQSSAYDSQSAGAVISALNTGNVGIGTTSPYAKLSVSGQTVADYFSVSSTTATSTFSWLASTRSDVGTVIGGAWNGSIIGVGYGGTGISTLPTYGKLLLGNNSSGYNLVATSSLGISSSDVIEGSKLFYTDARVGSYITGSSTMKAFENYWTQSGSNAYYNTGNVGIGTTSPYTALSVSGQVVADNFFATSTTATSSFMGTLAIGTSTPYANPLLMVGTSTSPLFYIDRNSGELGIGTSSPTSALSIYRGLDANLSFSNGTVRGYVGVDNGGTLDLGSYSATDVKFETNGLERVRILSTGNVGIGTTSPYAALSVTGQVVAQYFTATDTNATSTLLGILSVGSSTPPISSLFSIGTTSSLFYIDKNTGRVGIGTTSPYANLSIVGQTSPALLIATTTTNANALFYVDSTTTGAMDYARVAVGTTSIGSLGLRDQFTLAGRYYSTWKELRCDAFGSGAVANITSDTSHVCGDYSFDMNSSGQITASTSVALPYFGRIGITTIAVANAATVRTWTRYVDKTLNPVMETSVKIPQATSTTMYLVGFYGANAGTATPQYLPTQGGAFFVATSTNTWIAITATSPTSQTYTNTNVATSTSLQKMRVELTSTQATFLINDNVVATSNTNLPTAQLSPAIELAITSGSGTYSVFFDISYIKTWSDDPPGDRVVAADDSTPDQTNDSFIYSGNYYTELANSSFPGDYWKVTNVFATGTDPGGLSFYNGTHSFGSLKLSNAGNVGIGTSSPYAKLSVAGTVVADDNIVAPNFVAASTTVASVFAGGINITGGCLAINGVCINTNNILATPSASSTDQSIISLGFSWVLDQLKGIGVTIADGIVSAKEFIAEKVTAKKVVTDSFEMKTPSGVTYCVKLNDAGEFEKTQGACADQPISNGSSATETSVTLDPATTTTPAETSSSTADLAPATDTPPAT